MKQNIIVIALVLVFPFLVATEASARFGEGGRGNGYGKQSGKSMKHGQMSQRGGHEDPGQIVDGYPTYDLTDGQKDALKFMWEEEKLARDVYTHFIDIYGSRVFVNISRSEQKHMDAIGALLNKYSLDRPSNESDYGVYTNAELQKLYRDLVAKGEQSERDAFEVGRTIELVDIADLEESMLTAEPDAKDIYSRLLRASQKHLSAFERQLSK